MNHDSKLNWTDSSIEEFSADSGAKTRREVVISNHHTARVDKDSYWDLEHRVQKTPLQVVSYRFTKNGTWNLQMQHALSVNLSLQVPQKQLHPESRSLQRKEDN